MMDVSRRNHASSAQVTALVDFMQDHSILAGGSQSTGVEKEDLDTQWKELANSLNSMGGAVKSVDKWKQTWRDLRANTKKRALKQQQSFGDTLRIGDNPDSLQNSEASQNADSDNYVPAKKKYASFDEEIIKIERDKLELDREYKVQKIEVLSRIASALEELARKK